MTNFLDLHPDGHDGNAAYFEGFAMELAGRKDFLAEPVRHIGPTASGDLALRGRCHTNVENWIDAHGGARVFGWLVDDSEVTSSGILKFYAHSLLRTVAGELQDVTLPPDQAPLPFLKACLLEEQFEWMAQRTPILAAVVNPDLHREFIHSIDQQLALPRG